MTNRQRVTLIGLLAGFLVIVVLTWATLFTVDEKEMAVVLQFGRPVASYEDPGLKFKVPFVQEVRKLPKTYQFSFGARGRQVLEDLPTADGKKIEVTAWIIWRITDPEQFVKVLQTVERADLRVAEFVRGATRRVITSNELAEVVRSTDRDLTYPMLTDLLKVLEEDAKQSGLQAEGDEPGQAPPPKAPEDVTAGGQEETLQDWLRAQIETKEKIESGREKIVEDIKNEVERELATFGDKKGGGRGIELVDLGIARIDFVDAVREKAFERQITRWESISSFYVNQGEKQKQQILNRTEAKVQEVLGDGKKQANEIRGEVDARIIEAYARALEETGEFYNFIRTLEAYKEAMGSNTRLVLTTDSEMFKLLKAIPPSSPAEPSAMPSEDQPPTHAPPPPKAGS